MKYKFSEELQAVARDIASKLFPHVRMDRVKCFISFGTSSRRTIARCHGLGKLMQEGLEVEPFYIIEFLSERFSKLSSEDKIKVIIHELMHIPYSFGGGFKHHDYVTTKNVNIMYEKYLEIRRNEI
jgi:predicted metallopeptidase